MSLKKDIKTVVDEFTKMGVKKQSRNTFMYSSFNCAEALSESIELIKSIRKRKSIAEKDLVYPTIGIICDKFLKKHGIEK